MRDTASVAKTCGYVLTEAGREALKWVGVCQCQPTLRGRDVECLKCGTFYGRVSLTASNNSMAGRPWQ